ncbi:substrate-binding periplasmic protein [Leifsonia sp. L25]|uniref:substrate-binding periplasmic protein n=1 Tax=Actinomycetes TaxID=1760 RepID=UPI003D68EEFB
MKHSTSRAVAALIGAGASVLILAGCASGSSGSTVDPSCTPKSTFSTLNSGSLTIAGPDYPPLFTYTDNKMAGVDGDILASFAAANCLKTTVNVLPAASVIQAVSGGQADVAAGGWYRTAARAKVVGQTQPDYSDPAVLVGIHPTKDIGDYKGKTIGTTQGYLWSDDMVKWGGDNVKLYQSPDAVFQDLMNGRIDVALMAVNEAAYRLKQNPGTKLSYTTIVPFAPVPATSTPSVTNFPFAKSNTKLGAALDAYITDIRNTGKLAKILEKYGIDKSAANPSAQK